MDRFIDNFAHFNTPLFCDLKSNMDRFIAFYLPTKTIENLYLKSNMDRFIVRILLFVLAVAVFKIQYG